MKALPKSLLTFLIAIISTITFAQTSIGFRGGVNFTTISQPDIIKSITPDFKSTIGTNVALVAEIGISENFALQPEIGYSQKGFKIEEGINVDIFNIPVPIGAKVVTKFNYFEAPLLAKFKFGSPQVQAYVVAGPVLSYATGGQLKTKAKILIDIPLTSTNLNLNALGFERFDIGATVGTGLMLHTKGGSIFADVRYTKGFKDVYDIPLIDLKLQNSGIGVNVGYMFPLTKKNNSSSKPRV